MDCLKEMWYLYLNKANRLPCGLIEDKGERQTYNNASGVNRQSRGFGRRMFLDNNASGVNRQRFNAADDVRSAEPANDTSTSQDDGKKSLRQYNKRSCGNYRKRRKARR
jgi:hypothetical protein